MRENDLSADGLIEMAKNINAQEGGAGEKAARLKKIAEKNMDEQQAEEFNRVLNDPAAMQKLLASDAAQKLMRKFRGEE